MLTSEIAFRACFASTDKFIILRQRLKIEGDPKAVKLLNFNNVIE